MTYEQMEQIISEIKKRNTETNRWEYTGKGYLDIPNSYSVSLHKEVPYIATCYGFSEIEEIKEIATPIGVPVIVTWNFLENRMEIYMN